MNFNKKAPATTATMAGGIKYKTMCQRMDLKKTIKREAELLKVPMLKAAGICVLGKMAPKIGIRMSPAPPPQMALSIKAMRLQMKMMKSVKI